jgi:TRAP-type mannitol/chloroaromatic compound transport system permease small subunit
MSALAQLSKFIDRFNTIIGYLCAFFVFSMVIVVFTVVVLRYGFNIGFIWMQEVYVWLHSFVFMLGAGFTYLANEHVRIDVFYREASKKYKATVDLFGNIFLLLPFLYIIWKYSYPFVYRSFLMNEVSREAGGMPALYILKSAILWFCIVLFLQLISNVIKSILTLTNHQGSGEKK